ncbi:MAG: hypothetical protein CL916_06595 [Deltaproteobacteria bacterium]|nr:hypothetical protein [Deltaproteobacteria bacterium]
MLCHLLIFVLPTLVACGSKTSVQEDTSPFISDDDTAFFEPSSDTQEPTVDTQDSSDTNIPHGPPFSISSVSPQYGPTIGGTEIHIYGSDFPTSLRVFIGTKEAQILSCNETKITVRTPSVDQEGLYDIQVQSQEGTVSHTQSFQYFDTAQGQTGILGHFDIQQQLGSYWSANEASFDAKLMFIIPQDVHWWHLSTPTMDICTHSDDIPSFSLYPLDISAPFLELSNAEDSIALVWDSFYELYEEDSNATLLPNDTTFSLNIEDGLLTHLSFPSFFHTSKPSVLLAPILDSDQPTTITRDQQFLWEPSDATWIRIRMARLDPVTEQYNEQIICTLYDDGVHTVDPEIWKSWDPDQQIDVYFSRALESISVAPHNLSQARIVGSYTIVGAGFSEN